MNKLIPLAQLTSGVLIIITDVTLSLSPPPTSVTAGHTQTWVTEGFHFSQQHTTLGFGNW